MCDLAELRRRPAGVAARQQTVTYEEASKWVELSMATARSAFFQMLDDINREEHCCGRPMLSAVVVNKETGMPGKGFFDLARKLGKCGEDEDLFYKQELEKVQAFWRPRARRRGPAHP
jgi:hypothetical protein